jgi:hypothetical protein
MAQLLYKIPRKKKGENLRIGTDLSSCILQFIPYLSILSTLCLVPEEKLVK